MAPEPGKGRTSRIAEPEATPDPSGSTPVILGIEESDDPPGDATVFQPVAAYNEVTGPVYEDSDDAAAWIMEKHPWGRYKNPGEWTIYAVPLHRSKSARS